MTWAKDVIPLVRSIGLVVGEAASTFLRIHCIAGVAEALASVDKSAEEGVVPFRAL
ncbi:MAG: hypothetical protein RMJ84_05455 [Sandaracinaceae bacterium]|nr:hypothetical protein [Sandaracinaceae bacterium]